MSWLSQINLAELIPSCVGIFAEQKMSEVGSKFPIFDNVSSYGEEYSHPTGGRTHEAEVDDDRDE